MEPSSHKEILETMRKEIWNFYDSNGKIKENIDKDKLDLILRYITELNMILDNHDARLRLIERCFNAVKQTYFNIDLK